MARLNGTVMSYRKVHVQALKYMIIIFIQNSPKTSFEKQKGKKREET